MASTAYDPAMPGSVSKAKAPSNNQYDLDPEVVVSNRNGDVLIKHTVLKADHFPSEFRSISFVLLCILCQNPRAYVVADVLCRLPQYKAHAHPGGRPQLSPGERWSSSESDETEPRASASLLTRSAWHANFWAGQGGCPYASPAACVLSATGPQGCVSACLHVGEGADAAPLCCACTLPVEPSVCVARLPSTVVCIKISNQAHLPTNNLRTFCVQPTGGGPACVWCGYPYSDWPEADHAHPGGT